MVETILANEFLSYLIALGVFLITVVICCKHYKKYGFLQGIFSIICVPMLVHGIGVLLVYIYKENPDMAQIINDSLLGLEGIKSIFVKLFEQIGIKWFYETGGFYLPFGILFVLTYGYSITWRKKHKNNKNQEDINK